MSVSLTLAYELLENDMCKVTHNINDGNFKISAYSIVSVKDFKRELKSYIESEDHILDFTYKDKVKGIKQQFLIYNTTYKNLVLDYSLSNKFHVGVIIKSECRNTIRVMCMLLLKNLKKDTKIYAESKYLVSKGNLEETLNFYIKEKDNRPSMIMNNENMTLLINCYDRKILNRYGACDEIINNSAYKFGIYQNMFGRYYINFLYRHANEETFSLTFTCEGIYEKYKAQGLQFIYLHSEILTYDLLGLEYLNNYSSI